MTILFFLTNLLSLLSLFAQIKYSSAINKPKKIILAIDWVVKKALFKGGKTYIGGKRNARKPIKNNFSFHLLIKRVKLILKK